MQDMKTLCFICVALVTSLAVPIWSRALNDVEACTGKSIYILDLSMFAADHGMPTCDVMKASCSRLHCISMNCKKFFFPTKSQNLCADHLQFFSRPGHAIASCQCTKQDKCMPPSRLLTDKHFGAGHED